MFSTINQLQAQKQNGQQNQNHFITSQSRGVPVVTTMSYGSTQTTSNLGTEDVMRDESIKYIQTVSSNIWVLSETFTEGYYGPTDAIKLLDHGVDELKK